MESYEEFDDGASTPMYIRSRLEKSQILVLREQVCRREILVYSRIPYEEEAQRFVWTLEVSTT